MSDEAGFLQAIHDNPDDLTPRFVYADWLDDRGDPRAEYLRLKLQIAELNARLTQLGEELDPSWLAAVRGPMSRSGELALCSGRDVRLTRVNQHEVYAGLIEGLPTREGNERRINQLLTVERDQNGGNVYLIPPEERPIVWDRDEPYRFGTPAALPGICCVGHLLSYEPARDRSHDGSSLTVIWFQDEYVFPIDPVVREQIRAIDWGTHATDFNW